MVAGRFGFLATLYFDVSAAGGLVDQHDLTSEGLLLADLTQSGNQVTANLQFCEIGVPPIPIGSGPPLTFSLDPSTLAGIHLQTTAMLGAPQAGGCASYTQAAPAVLVLGAKMAAPLTDPLPTSTQRLCGGHLSSCAQATTPSNGACVCDQEGDGHPGVTLGVMNSPVPLDQVYVTLRTTITLNGQVQSLDRMGGTAQVQLAQEILGCHQPQGNCDVSIIQGVSPVITQSADAEHPSTYDGRRVAQTVDCAALQAMKGTLFQ
jgi:hypothetical protein